MMIVLIHHLAIAQIGIFETYDDYLNNKVIEYPGFKSTYHAAGNFKVVFLDKDGEKVKIDVDKASMWGYRNGYGYVLRVNEKNNPNVIILEGEIIVYGNYSTYFTADGASMRSNQFAPQISRGLNGKMMDLNKKKSENNARR